MLIIGVCDDNNVDRIQLCTTIKTYLQNQCIDGKIFTYDSAEKLATVIESKRIIFDIVFFDIVVGDVDGMAYARWIRQQDKLVAIVFSSNSPDYVYEGYEVNARAYLLKPLDNEKVLAVLNRTITQIEESGQERIFITNGGVVQRILIKDILYLESQKNKVVIVLAQTGERLAVYTTLDEFAQLHQSKMWIRHHKSYIVNFIYIEQYTSDKFVLRNGTIIPISRIYKDKAKECFFTLLHNH